MATAISRNNHYLWCTNNQRSGHAVCPALTHCWPNVQSWNSQWNIALDIWSDAWLPDEDHINQKYPLTNEDVAGQIQRSKSFLRAKRKPKVRKWFQEMSFPNRWIYSKARELALGFHIQFWFPEIRLIMAVKFQLSQLVGLSHIEIWKATTSHENEPKSTINPIKYMFGCRFIANTLFTTWKENVDWVSTHGRLIFTFSMCGS